MILLDHAPYTPFAHPRWAHPPGLTALAMDEWIVVHDDYSAQMDYRAEILDRHRGVVLAEQPSARSATEELFDAVLDNLDQRPDFQVSEDHAIRPDTAKVALDRGRPLETLNNLVAEDWCVMQRHEDEDEYRLTAAILCFPSRWLLSEKIGHPLTMIHDPVPHYDDKLARRVNRVFDVLSPEKPLVRCNWLVHGDPELHRPLGRFQKDHTREEPVHGLFLRTERQTLVRLPKTDAVVFGIKTSVTPLDRLTRDASVALLAELEALAQETLDYSERGDVFTSAVEDLRMRVAP
ncbi:MAG: DUF3445 domain-containing protein [Pseudomonadota bacterium]